MNTPELNHPVRRVVELLMEQKYSELVSLTNRIRLGVEDIDQAIATYGRKLVMPPEDSYELLDMVRVKNAEPPEWSVVMPLWTEEEGRSDLSVLLTVVKEATGFSIELDDIHVL